MAIYKVRKRNGAIVTFEREKIENAIIKAIKSVGGSDFTGVKGITDNIIELLGEKVGSDIPEIEQIQDLVEETLIKAGHDTVAKAYIIYRQKRAETRQEKDTIIEVEKTMDDYLQNLDWRIKENANIGYSIGGLILKNSEKVVANYWLGKIYPKEVGNAHRNGDYHIHDLGMFAPYCAGWSLRQLLEEGFNGVPGKLNSAPPRHLSSAISQMVNFLGTLQNEWAGAQAFSSFDTYMAPFVHKYEDEIKQELEEANAQFKTPKEREDFINNKVYKYVKQSIQNFVFNINVPSRWGTQTPFVNITLDWTCPDDLKDKALLLGGIQKGYYPKKFGELQKEMDLINKILIEVYTEGDEGETVFTFPIPTYNITEDFDWNGPNVEALFEMTAKYGIPYFQNFVGSQFKYEKDKDGNMVKVPNPDAYTPGAVRSMCCRLQLDLKMLERRGGGLFGSAEMTGSVGVVTINAARIGYNFKGDIEGFKKQVKHLMELAKISLEIKRKEMDKWLDAGLFPYTKRYLTARFRNHFSTIGINGMNEAILNFTHGKEDISTEWGKSFATDILDYMREVLKDYQEETGNLYNLEATPAEGTTYRFAREDQKQMPKIIQSGTSEAPYYTNSTQLPVGFTDDPYTALDEQNELQCKYTGGTVLHMYMGERITDSKACRDFVKTVIENYQLPYITISPTFSLCPKHGYIAGEHDFCPKCDEEIGYKGQKFDIDTREKYTDDEEKLKELKDLQTI